MNGAIHKNGNPVGGPNIQDYLCLLDKGESPGQPHCCQHAQRSCLLGVDQVFVGTQKDRTGKAQGAVPREGEWVRIGEVSRHLPGAYVLFGQSRLAGQRRLGFVYPPHHLVPCPPHHLLDGARACAFLAARNHDHGTAPEQNVVADVRHRQARLAGSKQVPRERLQLVLGDTAWCVCQRTMLAICL